jgi:hypothetical protein
MQGQTGFMGLLEFWEVSDAERKSQCFFVKTGMSLKALYRCNLIRALLSLIRAIARSARPTFISFASSDTAEYDSNAHVSALAIRGSIILLSSTMR